MRFKTLSASVLSFALAVPAMGQAERGCDDEQPQASAWIQWAFGKRAVCLMTASSLDARTRCLQDVRQELASLEREHAQVYFGQIRTLDAGHPVVRNLIAKLQDNVRAADVALTTDAQPEEIAAFRKEICLNRR